MLQVHGEMNYNGAEGVGNSRIVGNPQVLGITTRTRLGTGKLASRKQSADAPE